MYVGVCVWGFGLYVNLSCVTLLDVNCVIVWVYMYVNCMIVYVGVCV